MDTKPILEILLEDHGYIRRVLELFARELTAFAENRAPDYDVLAEVLDYQRDYLDTVHHPLEDRIAEHLKRRLPTSAESLAGLHQAHQDLERLATKITQGFIAARADVPAPRGRLCTRSKNLIKIYHDHLAWEETHLFPLAQKTLTAADWEKLVREDEAAPDLSHAQQSRDRFVVWLQGYDDQSAESDR